MMKKFNKQSGLTMSGFLTVAVLLVALAIFGMKLIPAYIENSRIQKSFETIVRDPAMQTASIEEIKLAFIKRAITMDDVRSVNQNDIEIDRAGGTLTLSVNYVVKIPLAGNLSLLAEFNPSARK